jgi:hypothetical protein
VSRRVSQSRRRGGRDVGGLSSLGGLRRFPVVMRFRERSRSKSAKAAYIRRVAALGVADCHKVGLWMPPALAEAVAFLRAELSAHRSGLDQTSGARAPGRAPGRAHHREEP